VPSLSLEESRRRADLLTITSYDVSLGLAGDDRTFTSTTVIDFTASGNGDTFVDVQPVHLSSARLNGAVIDADLLDDGRLPLSVRNGQNQLVVQAVMGYRNDGEGLHRAVDPADGLHYTYAMSAVDAAPKIFACFDQPDLKAPYTFHVIAPTDWVVFGNASAEQVEPGVWELRESQPLSTYFVTVVAGPYHAIHSEHDGIALGLSCRRSLAPHLDVDAEEILRVTGQCFDEYHRLFGIRYAFGDYHQAFVPEFNMGAMENPGCVTFRDPLVFTSKVTDAQRSLRARIIAHEMAHQWFGNLVTMRWWDDLWLNESFAEHMGYQVAQDVTDFQDAWVEAAFTRKQFGLLADQRPSTHPVASNGARDAGSALRDLDGISYVKGAAAVKQLGARLGEKVFLGGLTDHFTRHRFGNATMQDLFGSWERAGAGDLDAWASGWLRTPGLDAFEVDRSAGLLRRSTPERFPAEREHLFSVVGWDRGGAPQEARLTVTSPETPLPAGLGGGPLVLDPYDETWARFALDDQTLAALPDLLPSIEEPITRGVVWNAVRDGVHNAAIDPRTALDLVVTALPHEDQVVAVEQLSRFGSRTLAAVILIDHVVALTRMHGAARARLASAAPGSDVQLSAVRAVVESATSGDHLRSWLSGVDLPAGIVVDLDLRWRILIRLAALGEVDRGELESALAAEPTAVAKVSLAVALAALPDEEAKSWAWDRFTGAVAVPNYELYAAGDGMWQRGQEHLTAPYVDRFFAEITSTAEVRSGYVLAQSAHSFFPSLSVDAATVSRADRLLENDDVDAGLRRALVDEADDLRRALQARQVFRLGQE
jgi:aminopeptidase N